MLKFKVKGIKFAQAYVVGKHIKLIKVTKEGLQKAGRLIQNEVKLSIAGHRAEKTSVDTGRFLNSVDIVQSKDSVMIFSDIEYSKFLEFGTSRTPARKHFSNTQHRNKKKIEDIIREEVRKI